MKTVRFSQVVAKRGRPKNHLVLTAPKKDPVLQTAAQAKRVLTLMQSPSGTKADWGEVGFHPGIGRQYLIFPKSLAAYEGKAFIGIKYDLLSDAEAPSRRAAARPEPAKKVPSKAKPPKAEKSPVPAPTEKAPPKPARPSTERAPAEPVQPPEKKEALNIDALKRQVKKAMQALEKGRQVVAFNLLQKIVED